jgi:Lysozyme like domain
VRKVAKVAVALTLRHVRTPMLSRRFAAAGIRPWVDAEHAKCTTEKVILATKKIPNRKFSTLTVAAAGCAVVVAAIASGGATSAATAASATGPAAAAEPHQGAVLDAFTGPLTADYSFGALEHIWMAVGGSGRTASHAACIAEHESGGNPNAISRTNDWGLWQIHNGGPRMLNPAANAATAVRMSDNGRNWSAWTTARFC